MPQIKRPVPALAIVQGNNHHLFCEEPGVEFQIEQCEDQRYFTGAIKFGQTIDLLGISQTPKLLEFGIVHKTDVIDPLIELTDIYYKTGNLLNRFKIAGDPFGRFVADPIGSYRGMKIHYENEDIIVYGNVNMETGVAFIDATNKKSGVEPLAFRLKAFRVNYNRRV